MLQLSAAERPIFYSVEMFLPLFFLETTPKMSKVIFATLVAALVCVAGSAKAANGISPSTLSQMGLTGLTRHVRSAMPWPSVASVSRGINHSMGTGSCCGPRGSASPRHGVAGNSFATMNVDTGSNSCPTCTQSGSSHSENSYNAAGPYSSSGDNYSEAGSTITKSESLTASAR